MANLFTRKLSIPGLALVLASCLPAAAQQDYRTNPANRPPDPRMQAGLSGLEKENLAYVAASAAEIQVVLEQDPGLLVELKREVAQEASNSGQLVEED